MNMPEEDLNGKLEKSMKRLRAFIRKQKYVKVAYLFGSAAKGELGPLSDIDLAFLLDERLSKGRRGDKLLFLINSISDILNTDRFDVVIMNDMPLLFKFNIIKHGQVIGCKDNSERVMFETHIMSEYLDRDYYDSMFVKKDFERIEKFGIL